MNFPKIWKFLTPLILGFLLPEFGWIPVLAMAVSSAYPSRISVLVSTLLWLFSALSTQKELPQSAWNNPCQLRVEIDGITGKPPYHSFEATVLQGNLKPGTRLLMKIHKSETQIPQIDEQWWIRGKAEWPAEPRNQNQFSDLKYLKSKGLNAYVQVSKGGLICLKPANPNSKESTSLAKKWADQIQRHSLSAETGYLVRALLLGDKSGLTKPIKEWFRKTGLSHLLAVSGLHVGILFAGLNLILLVFPGKNTWITLSKTILLSISLFCYSGLTGFSPSVLRASLMLGFAQWFLVFRKKPNGLQTLGLAIFFLLAFNPQILSNAGFQLSVLAVAGILTMEPIFRTFKPKWIHSWLWSGLSVSLAAQITTAPLMLSWTGQFPTWFLITNLIAIPITTLFIYLSVVWFVGVLAFDSLPLLDELFSRIGKFYLMGIEWMGAWPNSELLLFKPEPTQFMLAYGFLISLLWKISTKSQWPYFWISMLLFAAWSFYQQHKSLPVHLVIQANRTQPKVFLWNKHFNGPFIEFPADSLPSKIQFNEKLIFLINKPIDLSSMKNADALIWLNRKKPPKIWAQEIPPNIKKFSLQNFPDANWIPLGDSTDMILY